MRQSINIALLGILAVVMSGAQANEHHHNEAANPAQAAAEQQVISASGVVKEIDLNNKKITIAHQAIPSLGWPAMTMRFTFITPDNGIRDIAVGSPVAFTFVQQGNISLLQDIKAGQP